MKKMPVAVAVVFLTILLFASSDSLAFLNMASGCTDCHLFPDGAGLHTTHSSDNCTACHSSTPAQGNVTSKKCIMCHPAGTPGKCQLANLASHPKTGAQSCISSCHPDCTPRSTTTTVPATTTTVPCPFHKALGDDHPALETLRDFRDSRLAQSLVGRWVIDVYYSHADAINAALDRSPALKAAVRRLVEAAAPLAHKKQP